MDMSQLLIELNKNNFEVFHFNQNMCYLSLKDDFEIILQLSNHAICSNRADLLKDILQNYNVYLEKAIQQLKRFHIKIDKTYFSYGIFVGKFSFGTHGLNLLDGFTISLKRSSGNADDYLNLDVYTVQFKSNGQPLGIDLWFE